MSRSVEECLVPGLVIGNLTLIEPTRSPTRRGTFWKCACACGASVLKYAGHLKAGQAKSCGCVKGANRTHNMSHAPEYGAWDNARSRCYSPKNRKYEDYGGRGIVMCESWRFSFANFIADMGQRPSPKHSLDRINNDGPYSAGNCRWADSITQNNNRRPFK